MHLGNRCWLQELSKRYPAHFDRSARVFEVGALDINGSAREHIAAEKYVGIDLCAGKGVDYVCDISEASFTLSAAPFPQDQYNTGILLSVFEHTPHWRNILRNVSEVLAPDALVLLCWGAEGNVFHGPEPWALVPHAEVWKFVVYEMGGRLEILDGFFEDHRYPSDGTPGAYDLLLRKR